MKENKVIKGVLFFLEVFVLLFIASCSQKSFHTSEDLMVYVSNPENGYRQEKSINGVEYSITYRPTDILVKQWLGDNPSQNDVDSLRKKYNKYMYFNFSLAKNKQEILNSLVTNKEDFGKMVNQLAFGMNERVHLFSSNKDSIAIADYIYPRLYGMSGATSMLLVYPKDPKLMANEFFHFTVEDLGLATGEISFKIPTKPIKNEPKLKF
ncbi:hypothetical protein [Pricia sp.]|uniref:hypothetical protein n=1 Tax=Pricia sp. TaxID=2268138 RepID=UPI0035944E75